MDGRASRYFREGQTQRWLDLYEQPRQVLSEVSTEPKTRFALLWRLEIDSHESHELVELYIGRKHFYKAEVLLEDLLLHFADCDDEEECLWYQSKLIELYTLSVERINGMPIEGVDSEAKKLLASMSILDRIARIDFDMLSYHVIDERLVKFQEGFDLGLALYFAAKHGACNLASIALDQGADFGAIVAPSRRSALWPPLHEAVNGEHIDMVRLLVARGANLEGRTFTLSKDWLKPLHIAVKKGRLAIVVYLLSHGANIEASCQMARTPLIWAAREKHTEIVQYLLERGADIHKVDKDGRTALHHAVCTQNSPILRLTEGVCLRLTECIDALVDHGIDVDAKDAGMKTALHVASREATPATVEHLISKGASLTTECYSGTALHAVMTPFGKPQLPMVYTLLHNGADINRRRSSDGKTPLHAAVCDLVFGGHNDLSVVSCLLAHRPDAGILDDKSKSALDYARGNEAVTAMLMQYLSMPPAPDQGQSNMFDFR
ncbi:hypothetical protein XANCAGTX0491_001576 [Xanthoria calcicola]